MRIGKTFRFEAAHDLPNHDGKCRGLHGHSYRIEVILEGDPQTEGPKEGMVLDFADLKEVWQRVIHRRLDHQYLNDVLPFVTTAENISLWILGVLNAELPQVRTVRVWETEGAWAESSL